MSREGKGHQEIGTRQQAAALLSKPALGLSLVTLRAGAIAARVVGKDFLPTVIAQVDMAPKERRTASGNIPECAFTVRGQSVAEFLAVRRAVEANDIGHLQHERPALEVFHEFIDRMHHGIASFLGQMGVDLRRTRAVVPEVFLNDAEVHAHFQ